MAQPDTRAPPSTPPGHGGTPPGQAGKPPTTQPPPSFQQPFVIAVGVDSGITITAINLSNTTISGPAENAHDVVGSVTIVTNPPDQPIATPLTLAGADAAKFVLTNSGKLPCDLAVGAANLPAGDYAITLSLEPTR